MNPDLSLALEMADAADADTLRNFRRPRWPCGRRWTCPRVGGRRGGRARAARDAGRTSPRRWILDPIDATKNYGDRPVVGVVSASALSRRWWAAAGEGAIEIAIEPTVAPWDMAAVQVIVEEAGGRFTDLRGDARFDGGGGLSTNGLLHEAVLEAFR